MHKELTRLYEKLLQIEAWWPNNDDEAVINYVRQMRARDKFVRMVEEAATIGFEPPEDAIYLGVWPL